MSYIWAGEGLRPFEPQAPPGTLPRSSWRSFPWSPCHRRSRCDHSFRTRCRLSATSRVFLATDTTHDRRYSDEGGARGAGGRPGRLTKKRAEVIVETVFGSIAETLRREEEVELRGFGSFRPRRSEPRRARNSKTGDRVDVASKHVAYFTPAKELKELINQNPAKPVPPPLTG